MSNTDFFPIERNRYFYGKLLTVRDFEVEQRYHRVKGQLLNRLSLGAGVVCGLGVMASDENTLLIESGMALDYQGRMMVLEQPLVRKLAMLDGYQDLTGHATAYLCMQYTETDLEPVNAVGTDAGENRQCNLTREQSRVYLTTQPPVYENLLQAAGWENVSVLYTSSDLTLILSAPENIYGGQSFEVQILVVKNEKTPPVWFRLDGESALVDSESGRMCLEFQQSPEEKRCVYTVSFSYAARRLQDMDSDLFVNGGELDLELGSHRYKNYIEIPVRLHLCGTEQQLEARNRLQDNLERRLRGQELPLYLAKLELIQSAGSVFVGGVTNLPFGQILGRRSSSAYTDCGPQSVTTTVRSLEYWQKPDVKAAYQPATGELHFDFGIPSPEQYDYTVAHGTVDLTLPGGLRVNSRVFSDEIAHGLGPGAVDIRLSLEYTDKTSQQTVLLYGNSEVFKGKHTPSTPIWAEAAALVYPERGTMRIGLWLHDMVDGNRVTVHYFAQKPERDTDRLIGRKTVKIQISPEFSRVACRGTVQFRADVSGSADRHVLWRVREENGGAIDQNGNYQAPEQPGTYEIVAQASAEESACASAFVIVEERNP